MRLKVSGKSKNSESAFPYWLGEVIELRQENNCPTVGLEQLRSVKLKFLRLERVKE